MAPHEVRERDGDRGGKRSSVCGSLRITRLAVSLLPLVGACAQLGGLTGGPVEDAASDGTRADAGADARLVPADARTDVGRPDTTTGSRADATDARAGATDARPDATDARPDDARADSKLPFTKPVVVLAEGQTAPYGIVEVRGTVYWSNDSASDRTLRAWSPTTDASGIVATATSAPSDLYTDGQYVYAVVGPTWGEVDGGCPDFLWFSAGVDAGGRLSCARASESTPSRLALDSLRIYEVSAQGGCNGPLDAGAYPLCIVGTTVPPSAGAAVNFHKSIAGQGSLVPGIASDGSSVYVAVVAQILAQSAVGGEPTVFYSGDQPIVDVIVDETYVMWVTASGQLMAQTKTAGAASLTLATGITSPWRLAQLDQNIYWTSLGVGPGTGSIESVAKPVAGSPPDASTPVRVIAQNQSTPRGLFVDGSGIYWTNTGDGTVRMIPY